MVLVSAKVVESLEEGKQQIENVLDSGSTANICNTYSGKNLSKRRSSRIPCICFKIDSCIHVSDHSLEGCTVCWGRLTLHSSTSSTYYIIYFAFNSSGLCC